MAERQSDKLCQGVKINGDPCNNYALKGSEYCRFHQPEEAAESENQCKWFNENGFPCDNSAEAGSDFCSIHQLDYLEEQPGSAGSPGGAAEEVSFSDRVGSFFQKVVVAFNSLFVSRRIIVDDFGSGDPYYLVFDFLNHINQRDEFGFYLPSGDTITSDQIANDSILPGVVNRRSETAEVTFSYVDYATGEERSTVIQLAPNQSFIDMDLGSIPAGQCGCTIRSDRGIQARSIVKLVLPEHSLSATQDAFIPYQIPISERTPMSVQNVAATLVLGSQGELLAVMTLSCELEDGRIYFDKRTMLKAINTNEAVDCILVIQLEGELIVAASTHASASNHMPDYNQDTAELKFETTAEVVAVGR
jgi:hypothetical protein